MMGRYERGFLLKTECSSPSPTVSRKASGCRVTLVKTLERLMAILKAQEVKAEKERGLRITKTFLSRFGLPLLAIK